MIWRHQGLSSSPLPWGVPYSFPWETHLWRLHYLGSVNLVINWAWPVWKEMILLATGESRNYDPQPFWICLVLTLPVTMASVGGTDLGYSCLVDSGKPIGTYFPLLVLACHNGSSWLLNSTDVMPLWIILSVKKFLMSPTQRRHIMFRRSWLIYVREKRFNYSHIYFWQYPIPESRMGAYLMSVDWVSTLCQNHLHFWLPIKNGIIMESLSMGRVDEMQSTLASISWVL